MLAQRLGAFVPPERVPEVWAGVAALFRDYGYRRLRSRARLKFLVADWGAERFREVLEREYLGGNALADGPAPPVPAPGSRDHIGVHRQRDGLYYVGVAPHTGRTSGTQLWQVADLAEAYGSGRVRTTIEQKLLILDVPERAVPELVAELEAIDLQASPDVFRRGTMACTGIEFCKLAIVETKGRARDLYTELGQPAARLRHADHDQRERLPELVRQVPARRHRAEGLDRRRRGRLPGAPWRLPRHRSRLRPEAARPEGNRGCAARLTSSGVLRNYQADRSDGEPFATWVRRADTDLVTRPAEQAEAATAAGPVRAGPVRAGPVRADSSAFRRTGMSGERQVPFFCPYCGEENLRPAGADAGEWECRACSRGFSLKFVGVVRPRPHDPALRGAL